MPTDRIEFVTAATHADAAAARLLVTALRRHHPHAVVHVAALEDDLIIEGAQPIDADALAFGRLSFAELAVVLDGPDLAAAAIPAVIASALDAGADVAVYVAPSVEVLAPLDAVAVAAARASLCLLPRLPRPLPADGARPDDLDAASAGAYRTGIVAATSAGRASLAWWAELNGMAWDRDIAPRDVLALVAATYPHEPPQDLDAHIDAWSLGDRCVSRRGDRVYVDDVPMATIDHAGRHADAPHRFSGVDAEPPRLRLSEQPDLAALLDARRSALGGDAASGRGASGRPHATLRRLYRRALHEALEERGPRPPSPRSDHAAFLDWCAASTIGGPVPVSRYLEEVRRGRADLLDAFPEVPGHDTVAFIEWARTHGREEGEVPDRFVPVAPPPFDPAPYTQAGVNLAGFLTAELGVGEVARRLATALDVSSIPHGTRTFARTASRTGYDFRTDGDERFDTNIVCVNADSFGTFVQTVGPQFFAGRRTIGVWFWETADLPHIFRPAFANLDEVWAASDFVADALRAAAPPGLPVVRFPLPIVAPAIDPGLDRAALALPEDRFVFLFSFDYLSVAERKNPYGLVDAFRAAFTPDEGPLLVIKSINGDRRPDDRERLHHAARGRADIELRDGYLEPAANAALIAFADCFVSLHRSEGFGFNIADAMALGRPVIATRFSGNLSFMREDDCALVDCREVTVGAGHFPYDADSQWAEPDLAHAVTLLRAVVADPAGAQARAAHAQARVLAEFSPAVTGRFIRNHLAGLRAEDDTPPAAVPGAATLPAAELARRIARRARSLTRR